MLVSSLSFSQSSQPSINPQDSFYVNVLYKNVVKANQAYIEVKHRRIQIDTLESIINRKDTAFKRVFDASMKTHNLNTEYLEIFKADQVKIRECEELQKKYDFAYGKLQFRQGFMQIGTPIIVIGVGALCLVGGMYLQKFLTK